MGLLARLEEIRNNLTPAPLGPRLVVDNQKDNKPEEDSWDSQYTQEEQQQIIEQIDKELQQSRLIADQETFVVKSSSKGWVLPLMVNILALIILLAFFFTMRYISNNRKVEESGSPQALILTEAKLLEEVRRESEDLLDQKDQELEQIRLEMANIEAQRAELEDQFAQDLSSYQQQIEADMNAAINDEIERLRAEGYAEEEINRRIAQFRNQKEEELNTLLESERIRLANEKAQQEEALNQLTSEYQGTLNQLNEEKIALEASYQSRLVNLEAQLEEAQSSSSEALNQAEQRLRLLSEQKELEQSIENQVSGFFATINSSLKAKNFEETQNQLSLFREFVEGERYNSLESISDNKDRDLFLISSLEQLTAYSSGGDAVPGALSYDPQAMASFENELENAMALVEEEKWEDAQSAVEEAMSQLPEGYLAYNPMDVFMEVQNGVIQAERRAEERSLIDGQTRELNAAWEEVSLSGADDASRLVSYMALLEKFPRASSASDRFQEWQQLNQQRNDTIQAERQTNLEELDSLQTAINSLNDEIAVLSNDYELASSTWDTEKQELEDQLDSLNKSLAEAQGRIESQQGTIDLLEDTSDVDAMITSLNNELEAAKRERDQLLYMRDAYEQLQLSYQEYVAAEDQLFLQGMDSDSLIEGKQLLNQFLSLQWIQEIFPGFAERIKVYDKAFQESGQEDIALEMSDLIFIYSTIDSPEGRSQWLEEQKESYNTDEMNEFFDSLELLAPNF